MPLCPSLRRHCRHCHPTAAPPLPLAAAPPPPPPLPFTLLLQHDALADLRVSLEKLPALARGRERRTLNAAMHDSDPFLGLDSDDENSGSDDPDGRMDDRCPDGGGGGDGGEMGGGGRRGSRGGGGEGGGGGSDGGLRPPAPGRKLWDGDHPDYPRGATAAQRSAQILAAASARAVRQRSARPARQRFRDTMLGKALLRLRDGKQDGTEPDVVNVTGGALSEPECRRLAAAFARRPGFQQLYACRAALGEDCVGMLLAGFQEPDFDPGRCRLRELYLMDNGFGQGAAVPIAGLLGALPTMAWCYLGGNRLADAGVRTLAAQLAHNTALRVLMLERNGVGDAGAQALAEAMRTNQTLTALNLAGNGIGDGGAAALGSALLSNCALTSLDLHGNCEGPAGREAIARTLRANANIRILM